MKKDYAVRVHIRLKEGILDPQAEAIKKALQQLEFSGVQKVDCEKSFLIRTQAESEGEAIESGRKMAQELLANLVMENFEVELVA